MLVLVNTGAVMKLLNIAGFDVLETDNEMTWDEAMAFPAIANAQQAGGFSDWVLPDMDTLKALQRVSEQKKGWFWSSSPNAGFSYGAWGVGFGLGLVGFNDKDDYGQVRLVRAGQFLASVNSADIANCLDKILEPIADTKAEQFETLSDLQINIALAQKLGRLVQVPEHCQIEVIGDTLHYYDEQRVLHQTHEDYCGDWSAIMPIAEELKMAIEAEAAAFEGPYGRWIATDFNIKNQYICESPKRALACCMLMMDLSKLEKEPG